MASRASYQYFRLNRRYQHQGGVWLYPGRYPFCPRAQGQGIVLHHDGASFALSEQDIEKLGTVGDLSDEEAKAALSFMGRRDELSDQCRQQERKIAALSAKLETRPVLEEFGALPQVQSESDNLDELIKQYLDAQKQGLTLAAKQLSECRRELEKHVSSAGSSLREAVRLVTHAQAYEPSRYPVQPTETAKEHPER